MKRSRVAIALVCAVSALAFAAIFFRLAAPTHPLVMAGARLAIASILLAPFVVRAVRRGALPRSVIASGILAGLFYAIHFGTWVTSLTLTTVAASVTLVTATPLLLAVVAIATGRDRPERRHFVAIALAIVGLTLISGTDLASAEALTGDALAFVGAATMAGYMLIVRRLGTTLDPLAFSGVATLVGAIALLGTAVVTGIPIAFASADAMLYVFLAALVPQLIGHTVLTWALRITRPTVVGLATVGEPVGATLLAWVWLGESVAPLALLGCAVTLGAVGIATTALSPALE